MAGTGEIRALTGLRGIAALYVVIYHFIFIYAPAPINALVRHGYLAVDLFFILSGFVMALNYGDMFKQRMELRAYGNFLWKRFGRIYPLYFVSTILVYLAILEGLIPFAHPLRHTLLFNIFAAQSWGFSWCINGPSWSISTEFAAYLLFPLLAVSSLYRARVLAWICAACSVAVLLFLAQLPPSAKGDLENFDFGPLDIFKSITVYPLMRCLAEFVLGLVAFRVFREDGVSWRRYATALSAATVLLLALPYSDLAVVAAFFALVPALACAPQSRVGMALSSGPVRWLGLISYSLYLVHSPIEQVLKRRVTAILQGLHVPHAYTFGYVPTFVIVLAAAAACYYGLEKPARTLVRKLAGLRSRPIAAEPSAF